MELEFSIENRRYMVGVSKKSQKAIIKSSPIPRENLVWDVPVWNRLCPQTEPPVVFHLTMRFSVLVTTSELHTQ
jgi:hypothetical protein